MPEKSSVSVCEMCHSSDFLCPRIAAALSSGPAEDGRWWPERGKERRAPVEQWQWPGEEQSVERENFVTNVLMWS